MPDSTWNEDFADARQDGRRQPTVTPTQTFLLASLTFGEFDQTDH